MVAQRNQWMNKVCVCDSVYALWNCVTLYCRSKCYCPPYCSSVGAHNTLLIHASVAAMISEFEKTVHTNLHRVIFLVIYNISYPSHSAILPLQEFELGVNFFPGMYARSSRLLSTFFRRRFVPRYMATISSADNETNDML